tara:strand:+ start:707 stop:1000 length:294 start_codon:yes stop_codon:yes gene_type:complete
MVYREDEQAPFDWDKFHGHERELNVLRNSVREMLDGDEELDVLDKKTIANIHKEWMIKSQIIHEERIDMLRSRIGNLAKDNRRLDRKVRKLEKQLAN